MKKAAQIFEIMKTHLHSKEFLNICKIGPKVFLRERLLSHKTTFLFILNLLKKSIPKELNSFCKFCAIDKTSRSAVTQARAKLSSLAFVELNRVLLSEFYNDNEFKKFKGLKIFAIDGSTIQLPINSLPIIQKYGYSSNQTKKQVPTAKISHLYDVLNGITLDAVIAPYKTPEKHLAIQNLENIKALKTIDLQQSLIIFDRGYPSLALIVYLIKNGINFLMRCSSQFLKEVKEVVKTRKRDTVIQISLKKARPTAKKEIKQFFPDLDMEGVITIRAIVVSLSTGEKEILITSLLCKKQYPYKVFLDLYFKRWGIEESYKFYKVQLEIENFSGKSCLAVEQDFQATVLAANAHALLALEAFEELTCDENRSIKKYVYGINKNVSVDELKDNFVFVLLNPEACVESFCKETKKIMKSNLIPIRPGRSFSRTRKHPYRKFHMNLR